jgi:hypothetical protein
MGANAQVGSDGSGGFPLWAMQEGCFHAARARFFYADARAQLALARLCALGGASELHAIALDQARRARRLASAARRQAHQCVCESFAMLG